MLLFMDGFDHYATADILAKWTGSNQMTITSGGRASTNSLFSLDETRVATKTIPNTTTPIVGAAFKFVGIVSNRTFLAVRDAGTVQVNLIFDGSNRIAAQRNGTTLGTTVGSYSTGTYYYIELKTTINNTTGTVDVYVDGVNVLSLTGQNTRATANNFANQVLVASVGGGGANIDDFYICDTTGTHNNDVLGDVSVLTVLPDGAGNSTQWTPSAGSNFQNVDEASPDGDTTYVTTTTINNVDTYTFADIGSTQSIKAVAVSADTKRTGGTMNLALITRRTGTDYASSDIAAPLSYTYLTQVLEEDPSTAAVWTEAGVNAAEFGIKRR